MWFSCTVTYTLISGVLDFLIMCRKGQLFETNMLFFSDFCINFPYIEAGFVRFILSNAHIHCDMYYSYAARDISESVLVSWGNFTSDYSLWTRLTRRLNKKTSLVPKWRGPFLGIQQNCWRLKLLSVDVFLVLLLWFI